MSSGATIFIFALLFIMYLMWNQREKENARREIDEYEARKARREDEIHELKRKLRESDGD